MVVVQISEDGKWSESVVERMHFDLLNKNCVITVVVGAP